MKKIFSFLALVFATLLIVSCSNDDSMSENPQLSVSKNVSGQENQKAISPDFLYYAKQIGILHNQYLKSSFNNFDYSSTNYKQEVLNGFSQVDKKLFNENYDSFIKYTTSEDQEKEVLNYITDPVALDVIDKFGDEITNSKNLADLIANIDRDLSDAEDRLSDDDYATLLVTAEVIKKSYEFWAPRELDGSGDGADILDNFNKSAITHKAPPKGWKGVVYADGIGAAGAFIGNAFFMGAGPVGVGAYFGSVAFAAGFSSAMGSW